jgi:hypothetical protein
VRGAGLALYNPLTDNWGELILVAGHPLPKPDEQAGASWDRVSANYLQNLGVARSRRYFTATDNGPRSWSPSFEAFVRRFFKSDEDPLDRHFGLDLPENVNTFRIVGVLRDARVAGFALDRPARPCTCASRPGGRLREHDDEASGVRVAFRAGLLLVTNMPPGPLEPLVKRALAGRSNFTVRPSGRSSSRSIGRSISSEPWRASPSCSESSPSSRRIGLCGVTACRSPAHERDRRPDGPRRRARKRRRTGVERSVRRVVVGLALGLPLAVGAGYLLSAQLYGVRSWDRWPWALAPFRSAPVPVAAIIPPGARRPSPILALRSD